MPASDGGAPLVRRRTSFWTLLVLLIAIGGFSFSMPGSSPAALAPAPLHGIGAPSFLWTPLTISAFSANPSPA
ncbi:MAG: hypothetical protein L3J95_05930, partial [Thermoplasmata archaeon]|nr:hypothetical protein [Thermoplasmata archaeon]